MDHSNEVLDSVKLPVNRLVSDYYVQQFLALYLPTSKYCWSLKGITNCLSPEFSVFSNIIILYIHAII